ncbi:hypothetical protein MiTe_04754 [Microcystis aeruginosa NIES-2520]|jgi:hypothetical protein|uniref:Uncharacterized protein n=1 Tax=Microcystis aeruginosa NIES-2520 TaxID=2303982 RepID=A0A5A5RXF1_MICAE|nr:hypothetical protein MiTe_04754 [Microcystis aeruginosa NIES-2520]
MLKFGSLESDIEHLIESVLPYHIETKRPSNHCQILHTPLIKGGAAPPLSRGDQGGIKGTIYLQFNNYNHSLNRIVTQRKNWLIQELLLC